MQQRRREAERANELDESLTFDTRDDENMTRNAYKVYTYLEPLCPERHIQAKCPMPHADIQKAMDDIYGFLFYGRSKVWPVGDSGKLVLTADEDGGSEPTYPYARLLLRFDAEAFLHTLDVAFEHSYLNESQGISRQIIVKILMDLVASVDGGLSSADSTFVRIFIARKRAQIPAVHTHIAYRAAKPPGRPRPLTWTKAPKKTDSWPLSSFCRFTIPGTAIMS